MNPLVFPLFPRIAFSFLILGLLACGRKSSEGSPPLPTSSSLPSGGGSATTSALAPSSVAAADSTPWPAASVEGVSLEAAKQLAAPVGGPWVTCYAHFRPTSTPVRDVTRLGMLCGPANGMRAVGPPEEGRVASGSEGKTHTFPLKAGECVRTFVVAETSLEEVEVALVSPTGGTLGAERGHDRWPILQADRPLCVPDDGTYTLRVRARKGAGGYALQAWRLP